METSDSVSRQSWDWEIIESLFKNYNLVPTYIADYVLWDYFDYEAFTFVGGHMGKVFFEC